MKQPVSLQINLAPGDYPHAKYILPHQLRILAPQVDEVVLTVDTRKSKGRFAEGWEKYSGLLNEFLGKEITAQYDNIRIIPVDYSPERMAETAGSFFGTKNMPVKDFRGGPFYAYFFGLLSAKNDIVFHMDSDMLLGGGSGQWVSDAVDLLQGDPHDFTVSPLAGPPHADDILIAQSDYERIAPHTFSFNSMSTRIFMLDRSVFKKKKLGLTKPGLRSQLKAVVEGNANADLPEHLISAFMQANQLKRIDLLGKGNGMWSLHPPFRTKTFYDHLPSIIERVEQNNMPPSQLGFYDVVDELCDWSEAREKLKQNRWWKRLGK